MIISFTGHSIISSGNNIKENVKKQIRTNITTSKPIICYLGGYGDFDNICACACRELKKEYTNIEIVYVMPYMGLSEQIKVKEMQNLALYDYSIYPPVKLW